MTRRFLWLRVCLSLMPLFYSYQENFVAKTGVVIQWSKGFVIFMGAFLEKKFRCLSLSVMSFILGWSFYFQAIGWFFMEKYHYGAGKIGLFTGFIGLVFAINTSFLSRWILKVFVKDWDTFLCLVSLMIVSIFACVLTHSQPWQWFWVVIIATGVVNCFTIVMNLFSNLAGRDAQGWVMGVVGSLSAMAWGLGALMSGLLGFMDIRVPLIMAGLFSVVSFMLMIYFKKAHYS